METIVTDKQWENKIMWSSLNPPAKMRSRCAQPAQTGVSSVQLPGLRQTLGWVGGSPGSYSSCGSLHVWVRGEVLRGSEENGGPGGDLHVYVISCRCHSPFFLLWREGRLFEKAAFKTMLCGLSSHRARGSWLSDRRWPGGSRSGDPVTHGS